MLLGSAETPINIAYMHQLSLCLHYPRPGEHVLEIHCRETTGTHQLEGRIQSTTLSAGMKGRVALLAHINSGFWWLLICNYSLGFNPAAMRSERNLAEVPNKVILNKST